MPRPSISHLIHLSPVCPITSSCFLHSCFSHTDLLFSSGGSVTSLHACVYSGHLTCHMVVVTVYLRGLKTDWKLKCIKELRGIYKPLDIMQKEHFVYVFMTSWWALCFLFARPLTPFLSSCLVPLAPIQTPKLHLIRVNSFLPLQSVQIPGIKGLSVGFHLPYSSLSIYDQIDKRYKGRNTEHLCCYYSKRDMMFCHHEVKFQNVYKQPKYSKEITKRKAKQKHGHDLACNELNITLIR